MVDEKEDTDDATETKKASDKPAKPATAKKAAKIENPSLPKDRNARVREQAARKMAEAKGQKSGGGGARPAAGALSTEELVDDALARGFARVLKWVKTNVRYIEGGVGLLVLIGVGYMVYDWRFNKNLEKASDSLTKAMNDANGRISTDDQSKPNDPDEVVDQRPKFPTVEARREAALSGYRVASIQYSGTGAAILGRLGEAGTLLDRKDFDGAAAAFRDVISTQLAKADLDVMLNATEGLGMALEGKGDVQGAMDAFKKLEGSKERGYAELGMYHQARILLTKKNERELAKSLLMRAKEGLTPPPQGESTAAPPPSHDFLMGQINGLLREIDPTLAPAPAAGGGSFDQLSIEQLLQQKKMLDRLRAKAAQQPQQVPNPGSPAPLPMPTGAPSK